VGCVSLTGGLLLALIDGVAAEGEARERLRDLRGGFGGLGFPVRMCMIEVSDFLGGCGGALCVARRQESRRRRHLNGTRKQGGSKLKTPEPS
jgi:hypothetical protein